MKLQGERFLPAPRDEVWTALNDPAVLQQCIPGCDAMTADGDDTYQIAMLAKVGPVSARFKGRILLSDLNPPEGYSLSFEGQGGAAGFGKGTAQVVLTDEQLETVAGTKLSYTAQAQVGGKIAQVGSRLIDAAAGKIAAEFFSRFERHFTAEPTAESPAEPEAATPPAPEPDAANPAAAKTSLWAKGKAWLQRD